MEAFLEFQHLKQFSLEDIKSITGDFDNKNVIGEGGFGKVYQGVISDSNGKIMAAFKRLSSNCGQGNPEFLKEIFMLSRYTHENLISLLGFCDEKGEKILVYEHASHGSLDSHLSSTTLKWTQRLKICLGAARGLCYLHDPMDTQERVIHRDIKSSNILIDESWNAKVSDMGLSKIGPANQQNTFLATNVVGTFWYVDPMYMETSILTKESDVYSFGLVLFEVLCGRQCFENNYGNFRSLVRKWKKNYKEKKLDEIIFPEPKQHLNPRSLEIFSDIAYRCLNKNRAERPNMSEVMEKLEIAFEMQGLFEENLEDTEPEMDYVEMGKSAMPPLVYKSEEELKMLLSKGIFVNEGKTWFLLNKNGEHCEMISAAECLIPMDAVISEGTNYDRNKSRFNVEYNRPYCKKFKTHVKTQFLSPHITYTVNLVFDFYQQKNEYVRLNLSFKLPGETNYSTLYIEDTRDDGWLMVELYQLTSETKNFDFEIMFDSYHQLVVEGIELQPVERVEHEVLEDEEVHIQTISNPDSYWEQLLPTDYEEIIKLSKNKDVQWTTKKELYSTLCKGFLINNGKEWFSLAKEGKKCHMISSRVVLDERQLNWWPFPQSRFGEVAVNPDERMRSFMIVGNSRILSTQTTYAIYLVYKLQGDLYAFEPPVKVTVIDNAVSIEGFSYEKDYSWYIYLLSPQTPIIRRKTYQNTHNPSIRPKMAGRPQKRNDGWMEVQVWEFRTSNDTRWIRTCNELTFLTPSRRTGLLMQGIEFRPI
ncbi:hypothetical protein Lser_V15G22909 [Lactuca serriola]